MYLAWAHETTLSAPLTAPSTPSSVARSALNPSDRLRDTLRTSSPAPSSFLWSRWPISEDAPKRTIKDAGPRAAIFFKRQQFRKSAAGRATADPACKLRVPFRMFSELYATRRTPKHTTGIRRRISTAVPRCDRGCRPCGRRRAILTRKYGRPVAAEMDRECRCPAEPDWRQPGPPDGGSPRT